MTQKKYLQKKRTGIESLMMLSLAYFIIPKLNLRHKIVKTKLYELWPAKLSPRYVSSRNGPCLVIRTSRTIRVIITPWTLRLDKWVPFNCTAGQGESSGIITLAQCQDLSKSQLLLAFLPPRLLLNSPRGRNQADGRLHVIFLSLSQYLGQCKM